MQAMLDAVRNAGFRGHVCVSGGHWATDPTTIDRFPLHDPLNKIVRGQHAYPAKNNNSPTQRPASLYSEEAVRGAASGRMLVSEAGFQHGQYSQFLASVARRCEELDVGVLFYAYGAPDSPDTTQPGLSLCASAQATLDVGGGMMVRPPSETGKAAFAALRPVRKARGFSL